MLAYCATFAPVIVSGSPSRSSRCTGVQHPITSGASYYGTAWSPDGTRIATLLASTTGRTLDTVNTSDGGDPQAVEEPTNLQHVPAWQPRGAGAHNED